LLFYGIRKKLGNPLTRLRSLPLAVCLVHGRFETEQQMKTDTRGMIEAMETKQMLRRLLQPRGA
jgi:hypothetical protein